MSIASRRAEQKQGLGYAHSFVAEFAIEQRAWLVTADTDFAKVGKSLAVFALPRHEK